MAVPVDPVAMFYQAASTNDIPMMEEALELVVKDKDRNVPMTLGTGLQYAANRNHIEMIQFLLDHGANMADMRPMAIYDDDQRPSVRTLQFLLDHGWDMNSWSGSGDREWQWPFLWTCLAHQNLVNWCLEHGARVDMYDERLSVINEVGEQEGTRNSCPPLLDYVARYGTVAQFELFRNRGAPLGFRMLHLATQRARSAALSEGITEPPPDDDDDPRFYHYRESMKMVKHILQIDEVDVNAQRLFLAEGDVCSTALCIVAFRPMENDRPLTRLLLDAGADPDLMGFWGSPRSCGELHGNRIFLKALEEWDNEKREQTASSV